MKTKTNIVAECPSCGEMVLFGKHPKLGELVVCRYCEEECEVISLDPVLLDFPLYDEDYDGDFDYDDDDDRW